MSRRMVFRRVLGGLYPTDELGERFLRRVHHNECCLIEGVVPRNIALLRKFWAVMDKVVENTERYERSEDLVAALKIATGFCRKFPAANSDLVFVVPDSIAVDAMTEDDFEQFYNKSMDIIFRDIMPGCSEAFRREISDMLDPAFRGVPRNE